MHCKKCLTIFLILLPAKLVTEYKVVSGLGSSFSWLFNILASGGEVSRTRSVEELQMSSPSSPQSDSHVTSSIKTSNKNTDSKVDWKGFQEAVSVIRMMIILQLIKRSEYFE